MALERFDTVVVGAGQAGIAASEHLSNNGTQHVVLERSRIAERWRTARWDSLVANGPAWHDRFPNLEFESADPDSFIHKDAVADYFVAYAEKINAPVRCGVEVLSVERKDRERGFLVKTDKGDFEALNVVVATGPFQQPAIPPIIPDTAAINQLHSSDYRNPAQLPAGNVLVVGAGSSGVQIADELARSGRKVYLSVGPHDRPPRAYRGRDFVWWLGVLGKWNLQAQAPGTEHVTIAVSGARGGETIDFRRLAENGMTLVGRTEDFENGVLSFAHDLADNIAGGDAYYLSLLDEADAYVARNGLDLPAEPEARVFGPTPDCIANPVSNLDLEEAGITTVIWATGFRSDYSWLKLDICDEHGRPVHQRGVSDEPGLYFLGLPWLSGRGSSFIWGVWHDAKYVADHILIQQKYRDYQAPSDGLRSAAE
ncbi:MAG: FAD-dependent oxidoreductase [Martelella sp.]|uniref:flavin-containing monooxygenase n=1 Tax=unclassified Martelella TaxID=2629616 RepID=UPI000C4F1808|nr:NAD(P)/FAD-dependent oxidoreductase [Martelella sp.]MAU21220.1 FAD-dependent oxidoreductase [Martelella sp.]|tara:strand:- start:418 stop:1695 length:1278 start_codon:yes stop_codon:yes gene_type:complete